MSVTTADECMDGPTTCYFSCIPW